MTTSSDRDQQIPALIQSRAEERCRKNLVGIAIGVMVDGQSWSAVNGWADAETKAPISDATLFEVGSISKLFTSLLLAVAVKKQEVGLDDPVQPALGDAVSLPTDGTAQITFRSLANHRSSLPRLPDDLIATADMENPYVHYDEDMLYACLSRMETVRSIGCRAEYSNFGVGLLGHALGKVAASDYRQSLSERVLVPLGMHGTVTGGCPQKDALLATAHKKKGKPTKHWDFRDATVGAGGVRSSLSDMFKFLRANLDPGTSPLADEIMLMREPSERPECQPSGRTVPVTHYLFAFLWVFAVLAIFMIPFGFVQWRDGFQPASLWIFPITIVCFAIGMFSGGIAALIASAVLTSVTKWYFGDGFDGMSTFIMASAVSYAGAQFAVAWKCRGGGEGRLAWQSSQIETHPMLWHNGRVGGSASFLGIIPDLEIGVVVLTNTAKPVDALGINLLSEMMKLKQGEHAQQDQRSLVERLKRWGMSLQHRLHVYLEMKM